MDYLLTHFKCEYMPRSLHVDLSLLSFHLRCTLYALSLFRLWNGLPISLSNVYIGAGCFGGHVVECVVYQFRPVCPVDVTSTCADTAR